MSRQFLARTLGVLATTLMLSGAPAHAQSANAVAMAREIIIIKGAAEMFTPLVPGVVETAKNNFMQTNPQLSRDLNEVALQLRKEFDSRRGEVTDEMAKIYAQRFSESELKEVLAFYKSPIGRKVVAEEPRAIDASMARINQWAEQFSEEVLSRFRSEMKKRGHTV